MGEIDEAELVSAGQCGTVIDGRADGGKRTVQAALLRSCCHELKDRIDPRGLRLANVIVAGGLDLSGLVVPFSLRFEGCEFDAAPVVEGAQLFELSLTGSPRLPGLLGNGLRLRRDLDLSRSHISGAHWTNASTSKRSAVWLCESEIGGRLLCVDTTIDGQGDRAIQADRTRVGGSVRLLHRFTSQGEIRLIGARIYGSVDITGAHLTSVNGPAIDLEDATVEGSMFLIEDPSGRRPVIRGRIGLGSTRISGRLLVRNATIDAHASGQRDPATWPPRFTISGLSYERFERPQGGRPTQIWDQAARCDWLSRQTDFDSGAHEQAARVFRQHGHISEAEEILMAQRRHAGRVDRPNTLSPRRGVDGLYALIGYGYRPTRVLWALVILLLAVLISLEVPASRATLRATNGSGDVYSVSGQVMVSGHPAAGPGAHTDACGDGAVRCFSPVLYTIDTVVPLISLDQRSTWYPDPHAPDGELLLLWLNLATLLGWLLSSIFVLSLARLSRST